MSRGHFGVSYFVPCREAVFFSEVEMYINFIHKYIVGDMENVLCREVVLFSEAPLTKVPLYWYTKQIVLSTCILLLHTLLCGSVLQHVPILVSLCHHDQWLFLLRALLQMSSYCLYPRYQNILLSCSRLRS